MHLMNPNPKISARVTIVFLILFHTITSLDNRLAAQEIIYARSGDGIGFAIMLFLGGLMMFYLGLKKIQRDRLIANMPTSKIRSMAMGLVELYGKIRAHKETITAPFSGKECVYCRVSVGEWRGSGKRRHLRMHRQREKGVLFNLEDDTGKVLIDARGADLTNLKRDVSIKLNQGGEMTDRLKDYCEKHNIEWKSTIGHRSMEFEETFIEPGEDLYIMGTAQHSPHSDKSDEHIGHKKIMIGYAQGQRMFYISDKSEKELLNKSASKSAFMVFGGIGLSALGLFMILSQFK